MCQFQTLGEFRNDSGGSFRAIVCNSSAMSVHRPGGRDGASRRSSELLSDATAQVKARELVAGSLRQSAGHLFTVPDGQMGSRRRSSASGRRSVDVDQFLHDIVGNDLYFDTEVALLPTTATAPGAFSNRPSLSSPALLPQGPVVPTAFAPVHNSAFTVLSMRGVPASDSAGPTPRPVAVSGNSVPSVGSTTAEEDDGNSLALSETSSTHGTPRDLPPVRPPSRSSYDSLLSSFDVTGTTVAVGSSAAAARKRTAGVGIAGPRSASQARKSMPSRSASIGVSPAPDDPVAPPVGYRGVSHLKARCVCVDCGVRPFPSTGCLMTLCAWCVCARVRACVRACACVCMCVRVCV